MEFLFPDFLTDRQQYHDAETLWQRRWVKLLERLREAEVWESPWMGTTFGDGTPMLDGDPIFSAVSAERAQGIRVIQLEPAANPYEMSIWLDKAGELQEISELVIACVLTEETLLYAIDAIEQWITRGQVYVQTGHRWPVFPRLPSGPRPLHVAPVAA